VTSHQSPRTGGIFAALALLAVLLACGQWDEPGDDVNDDLPYTSGVDTAVTTVDVSAIQVRVDDGAPSARLIGRLPDGCTEVTGAEAERSGETFFVSLATTRTDGICNTVGGSFEQQLALSDTALVDGYYVIRVDGTTASAGFDILQGALADTTLAPGWNAMPPDPSRLSRSFE
jgi:hypothetical protein